jgi:hypothetical protein
MPGAAVGVERIAGAGAAAAAAVTVAVLAGGKR